MFPPFYPGTEEHPAGWHCSWCFSPSGIRMKLTSAMNGDFPRWGDYPEKLNLTYIRGLVKRGAYFDDRLLDVIPRTQDDEEDKINFAPTYLTGKMNWNKFGYLIKNEEQGEGK